MFPNGLANAGKAPYPPAPSCDGPAEVREPGILEEIARIQKDAMDLASSAVDRANSLRARLAGKPNSPDMNALAEGLRFPPDGQLGEAYHAAWHIRQMLNHLHFELAQLENL